MAPGPPWPTILATGILLMLFACSGIRASCGLPEQPAFGFFNPRKTRFLENDIVQFKCQQKYFLLGPSQGQCGSAGRWNDSSPHCVQAVNLTTVVNQNDNSVNLSRLSDGDTQTSVAFDAPSNITIKLNTYYRLWKVAVTIKISDPSSSIPSEANDVAIVRILVKKDEQIIEGQKTSCELLSKTKEYSLVSCFRSFYPKSNEGNVIILEKQTNLSLRITELSIILDNSVSLRCGDPEVPLNGIIERSSYQDVEYSCQGEYILNGVGKRRCLSGAWTPDVPTCDEQNSKLTGYIEIAAAVGGCLLAFLLIFIVCILFYVRRLKTRNNARERDFRVSMVNDTYSSQAPIVFEHEDRYYEDVGLQDHIGRTSRLPSTDSARTHRSSRSSGCRKNPSADDARTMRTNHAPPEPHTQATSWMAVSNEYAEIGDLNHGSVSPQVNMSNVYAEPADISDPEPDYGPTYSIPYKK